MSESDNPIGLEPIPQESNSRMLTIYIMGYCCRFNRTRTHNPRVVFWSVIQLHHKPNCTSPWIRTKKSQRLKLMPFPVWPAKHFSTGRETSFDCAQDKLLISLLTLYRKRDSNSQNLVSKTRAYANSAIPA